MPFRFWITSTGIFFSLRGYWSARFFICLIKPTKISSDSIFSHLILLSMSASASKDPSRMCLTICSLTHSRAYKMPKSRKVWASSFWSRPSFTREFMKQSRAISIRSIKFYFVSVVSWPSASELLSVPILPSELSNNFAAAPTLFIALSETNFL